MDGKNRLVDATFAQADEWVADTQVEFEFFETTNYTYPSFYIYVLIDKNDESDICVYTVEVESIDGRIPVFSLDLSALDCLNVVNQTNDIEQLQSKTKDCFSAFSNCKCRKRINPIKIYRI